MATKKATTSKAKPRVEKVEVTATTTTTTAVSSREDSFAIAGFILGIFSLCAWFIPCIGVPTTVTGLVLSIMGLKSQKNKTFAIVGAVLCGLGLLASLANAAWGAYLGATGQYDVFEQNY